MWYSQTAGNARDCRKDLNHPWTTVQGIRFRCLTNFTRPRLRKLIGNPPHGSVGIVQVLSTNDLAKSPPRAKRAGGKNYIAIRKDLNHPRTAVRGILDCSRWPSIAARATR